jgi:hypothetical protein
MCDNKYIMEASPTRRGFLFLLLGQIFPDVKEKNPGAINPQTGEYYPPSGKLIINPRTGEYYPPSGTIRALTGAAMTKIHRNPRRISGIILIFLIFTFIFVSVLSSAQALDEAPKRDDGVLRTALENGLRVIIVRNTRAPVVTIMVNYLVGSNEAPDGFPGMAHAQEHMMFRGRHYRPDGRHVQRRHATDGYTVLPYRTCGGFGSGLTHRSNPDDRCSRQ